MSHWQILEQLSVVQYYSYSRAKNSLIVPKVIWLNSWISMHLSHPFSAFPTLSVNPLLQVLATLAASLINWYKEMGGGVINHLTPTNLCKLNGHPQHMHVISRHYSLI